MTDTAFLDSQLFSLAILPFLIFLARVSDVTIGTMRIIFVSRGFRFVAAAAGFFEILIWLFAIGQIMSNLGNWINYGAYASGYAVGNYIGITIERQLAMGYLVVRIITQKDGTALEENLRKANFVVTSVDAEGGRGPVKILFTILKRKALPAMVKLIKSTNPLAYYTVEDLRSVSSPGPHPVGGTKLFHFPSLRKGK
ncbi:MAG: DUF2179 domain-containing protein [bacterium]|nr:DUF2179 domain-containing protein [bacterium]MDT8366100.1 DUF2179 domain-containing protein [bacterium]